MSAPYKQPVSVLVVIHTPALEVLILERAGSTGLWQSVTGSREGDEAPAATALREVEPVHQPVDQAVVRAVGKGRIRLRRQLLAGHQLDRDQAKIGGNYDRQPRAERDHRSQG